jgi:hypothetical protein
MAEAIKAPRMTEPEPVDCRFIEGMEVEIREEFLRITGWIDLETAEEGLAPERRIVVRAAMPLLVARALILDMRSRLARGGN